MTPNEPPQHAASMLHVPFWPAHPTPEATSTTHLAVVGDEVRLARLELEEQVLVERGLAHGTDNRPQRPHLVSCVMVSAPNGVHSRGTCWQTGASPDRRC